MRGTHVRCRELVSLQKRHMFCNSIHYFVADVEGMWGRSKHLLEDSRKSDASTMLDVVVFPHFNEHFLNDNVCCSSHFSSLYSPCQAAAGVFSD